MCGLPFVPLPWGLQMLGEALEMSGSLWCWKPSLHHKERIYPISEPTQRKAEPRNGEWDWELVIWLTSPGPEDLPMKVQFLKIINSHFFCSSRVFCHWYQVSFWFGSGKFDTFKWRVSSRSDKIAVGKENAKEPNWGAFEKWGMSELWQ